MSAAGPVFVEPCGWCGESCKVAAPRSTPMCDECLELNYPADPELSDASAARMAARRWWEEEIARQRQERAARERAEEAHLYWRLYGADARSPS